MSNQIKENNNGVNQIRTLNIFCFNPSLCLTDIRKENPYAVIFTSGTLCPFSILENEFGIKFDSTLENEHIIKQEQFKFAILKQSKSNQKFRFDFRNKNNTEMKLALGETICTLCRSVKHGGVLVFFTSYSFLNNCSQLWNKNNILKKMSEYKTVFIDSPKNNNIINEFIHSKENNSIFMSVFRGKATEGIDFKDDFARMVICIGIPFADFYLDKVQLKRTYLNSLNIENNIKEEWEKNNKVISDANFIDSNNKNSKSKRLTGNEWYLHDAMTVVNQSLGRVIRHISDYGALVCIDERYDNNFTKSYFSKWIVKNNNSENFVKNDENALCKELLLFFHKNRNLNNLNDNNIINNLNNNLNNDLNLLESTTNIKECTAGFHNKAMQFTPEEMKKFEEENKKRIFIDENLSDNLSPERYDNSNEYDDDNNIFKTESEDEKNINNNNKNNIQSIDNKNQKNNKNEKKYVNNINSFNVLDKKNDKINIIQMNNQNDEIKNEYKTNRNEWLQSLLSTKTISENNIQDNEETNDNDIVIFIGKENEDINETFEKKTEEHIKNSEELLKSLRKFSREIGIAINKYKNTEKK